MAAPTVTGHDSQASPVYHGHSLDRGRYEGRGIPAADHELTALHVLTINCWGLKFISKHRTERLAEIGRRLATHSPPLDVVGLQECWTYADYLAIRSLTSVILPHGKFYHSGIFGGGLVILSRFPIEEASMYRYPLNGRPTAFFRGDWFVGKGVAHARLRTPQGSPPIEVFNTHLHAPYEREPNDSYICHRTAQAWEIAKLMRAARQRGSLVIGMGDFNMVPLSFAHVLIESRTGSDAGDAAASGSGGVRDVWRVRYPSSSVGASVDLPEAERRKTQGLAATPDVDESLHEHGHTCDSVLNTWRWDESHRKDLEKGQDRKISGDAPDPRAKRLDYIFFGGFEQGWEVESVNVALTDRHPELLCSLSDHFAVEACLRQRPVSVQATSSQQLVPQVHVDAPLRDPAHTDAQRDTVRLSVSGQDRDRTDTYARPSAATAPSTATSSAAPVLDPSFYRAILAMIHTYTLRERKQRRWRLGHFVGSALFSIGSFFAVWWSTYNYVAFVLLLVSTLGILAGTLDGLIGGLFVGSELRALNEFEWEVRNAFYLEAGGPRPEDASLQDWYD